MRPLPWFEGRSVTVVAPHPDDETIAAFGVLHDALRHAKRVEVIVVTDGSASHQSRRWPPRRLAAQRERETQAALARAGGGKHTLRFLHQSDSGLERLDREGWRALVRQLRRGPEPDFVFRPSEADFHADHKLVARACKAAWPPRVRQFAYLVWPEEGARWRPRFELRLKGLRGQKRAAIRCHRTQTGLIADDPDGFTMSPRMIARFCPPAESFASG